MIDSLRDIDDLFRDGLAAHEEKVPASVWNAVNNDLDQKQAAFYKQKYFHLQRIAAGLVALCFIAASIIYLHLFNEHQEFRSHKNDSTLVATKKSGDHLNGTSATNRSQVLEDKLIDQHKSENNLAQNEDVVQPARQFQRNRVITQASESRIEFSELNSQQIPVKSHLQLYHSIPLPSGYTNSENSFIILKPIVSKNENELKGPTSTIKLKPGSTGSFHLSAFVAPNISFQRLEDDHHLSGPGRNRHDFERDEAGKSSFSVGLQLDYSIARNFSIQSGLTVTNSKTSIAPKIIYAEPDNSGRAHFELHSSCGNVPLISKGVLPAFGDSLRTSGVTTSIAYITVPASISYRFYKGKIAISSSIGAGINFLVSARAKTILVNTGGAETVSSKINGLNSNYFDLHLGLGFEYLFNRSFSIGVKPNVRAALTPMNTSTPVKSYQNFVSVETGLRLKL